MSPTAGARARPIAAACAVLLAGALACRDRVLDVSGESTDDTTDGPVESARLVAVVNPVVNAAHNADIPAELGDARDGVDIDPEPGGQAATVDGLATVALEPGPLTLHIGPAQLDLDAAAGDVIDAPIAFDGTTAAFFPGTPLRYPVREGHATVFAPGAARTELEAALAEDGAVVVLRPGTYPGDLTIKGRDIVLFGEGWSEHAVIIDGSVTVDRTGARLRGLTITGDLTAKGNAFALGFSRVLGTTRVMGAGGILLRNILCGTVVTSASNTTLLDNFGMTPVSVPAGACDLQPT
ncbi:MAG TPA: hypothetical protein VIK91_23590 [Nannocystis sp.]